ncbi:MAG: DUF4041 domain-containing protein [Raoultibacter sp.]
MALFGNKKLEEELEHLRGRNAYLEQNMSPEMRACDSAASQLAQLKEQVAAWQKSYSDFVAGVNALKKQSDELQSEISEKRSQLVATNDELTAEEFGLYSPRFAFANSTQYKDGLKSVRDEQKAVLKSINEAAKKTQWTVNGSKVEGRKLVCDTQRLLMRAFNIECDELVAKVKTANISQTTERIRKSAEAVSKLGRVMNVSIPYEYASLKEKEAYLAYEFSMAKDKEREEIREAKAREREELKVQKEIEEKRKQLKKEETHYEKALAEATAKLEKAGADEIEALRAKVRELEANITEVKKGIADVDYREANKRAGFVYIISNIGSFGSGVFKIGMTRRLEPMERIMELSDASVPFNFDVHALIFSNDAPGLETALHREFEQKKLNLVNPRREFFKCSLDEIKGAVVKNYDKTVEFIDVPDAEQYRVSEKMRESI